MKYKKEEFKAGLVVTATLLIFGAMVILIGGSRFWEKQDTYFIRFSSIGGLEPGAAVRLGGFRVGRVLTIAVASDDPSKIDVTIGLKPETPIRKGAIAGISTLGLVGDYYILLTQKPGADQPLSPESQIPSRDMVEMGDLLVKAAELSQTLSVSVGSVVGAVDRLLSDENISHVQTALQGMSRLTIEGEKSLQLVTADIRNVLKRLNSLVVNVENLTIENKDNFKDTVLAIKTLAERMDVLVRNVDGTLSENREDLRATVAAIREDSQKAGQLIDHLDGRIDVTGDYLDETLINLMEVSENLRLLSIQLRRQPWRLIYRGGVKK